MGGPFFFSSPALVAMCQAELGNREAASGAREEALALDPTFAKDPHGAYRLHRVPESLIEQFMDGLHKAGLEDPAGQAAAAANWVAGTRARSEQLGPRSWFRLAEAPPGLIVPDNERLSMTSPGTTSTHPAMPRVFDEDSCRWRTNASHQPSRRILPCWRARARASRNGSRLEMPRPLGRRRPCRP
jgi:hypothetical protein